MRDKVYMDRLQHAAFVAESAQDFAQQKYNKLMRRTKNPNRINEDQ